MSTFRRPVGPAAAGDAIPFAVDGEIHLFYLSSPPGTTDYPERVCTSWQHVSSRDLQTWTTFPPALEPGAAGTVDAGGIWTGSVVEHDGTYWLFYTAHDPGAANPQAICLATSTDLVTFARHPGNPLLLPAASCEPVDWRDPYVFFNADEGQWWMLVAARSATGPRWRRGVIMLATSPDLLHWTVEREPLYSPGSTFCPECPELWTMDGRWYLVYSRFSEDVGTVYRVADSPRGPFRTPEDDRLGGRRWYAAKSAPDLRDGTRVFFGWIHDRVGTGADRRWLWGGDFGVPRKVSAADDGHLVVEPVLPHGSFSSEPVPVDVTLGEPGATQDVVLADSLTAGTRLDLELTTDDAAEVRIDIDDADERGWAVVWRPGRRSVELRVTPEPLDDFWADLTGTHDDRDVDGAVLAAAPRRGSASRARLTLLLDGDLLEVFVDGASPLTHRVSRSAGLRLTCASVDGTSRLVGALSHAPTAADAC